MNILPHKSWHVRRKDNIERVRRDEAKAADEEKERQRKIALAEQEARTDLLRSKNRKRVAETVESEAISENEGNDAATETSTSDDKKSINIYSGSGGHINFFKDAEDGIVEKKKNVEHEKEKKDEKEKWEKNVGILTYLGQSQTDDPTPWYLSKKRKKEEDGAISPRRERDEKRKKLMDPIYDLKNYVEKTKDAHSPERHKHKHKHKEKKKHKHKSKDKDRPQTTSSSKTIEQLRAERLRRESDEKKKTSELMAKLRGESVPDKSDHVELNERRRGYNSQYNPDFVRRPKDR
ncbi:leukocyte receptor cluster member 1 homolog [Mytilus californianus]|uniref:leukocyte receptor cluster member 1 homolog n=1 Tax=Mytilus californianus TaxID=6549 RepID=UPI002245D466|nr:leukocyte receptor cluster member 1 homolog [Mytilus californianus]